MALIDLAAIAPFYLQILMPGMDLRFLRVLRMLRIFKLTRYSSAMNVLLRVLHQERKAFSAAFTILVIMLIIVSCGIGMVALPSGILASSFSEMLRRRQQEFRLSVKKAMEDGTISDEEADNLDRIREELNLTKADSIELRNQTQKELEVAKNYEVAWEKIAIQDAADNSVKMAQPTPKQTEDHGKQDHPNPCPHCGRKLPD